MDKIKRIVLINIPTSACNFRCEYCYVSQFEGRRADLLPTFKYSPKQVGCSLSKKRMGGTCYVNMCGDGETLLPKEVLLYAKELLKQGHYVDLITNCVLEKRIDELLIFPKEYLERLMLKCSFHWLEMKRTDTLDAYVRNINKLKSAGIAYTIEITPHDSFIPHIPAIKEFCLSNFGSLPQITIAWNDALNTTMMSELSAEEFRKVWAVFDSPMTDFKLSIMGIKRREFCYAGDWSVFVNLGTGMAQQCYCSCVSYGDIFKNPKRPIKFMAIGNNCKTPHCRNGHMLLTLGTIPHLNSIHYEVIRNRICADNAEWLSPGVKAFLNSKLEDSNKEYSKVKKVLVNLRNILSVDNVAFSLSEKIPENIKSVIKSAIRTDRNTL